MCQYIRVFLIIQKDLVLIKCWVDRKPAAHCTQDGTDIVCAQSLDGAGRLDVADPEAGNDFVQMVVGHRKPAGWVSRGGQGGEGRQARRREI